MAANPQVFSTPQPMLGAGAHDGGTVAGRIAPQPVLDDGTRLDDRIGYRFAVIAAPAVLAQARLASDRRLAIVAASEPALRAWLDTLGVGAVLLRPDRHIAGTSRDAEGLHALLRRYLHTGGAD